MSAIALVTGSGKRIGRSIAVKLAQQGWKVAIHYNISVQDARETARLIHGSGGEARIFACDLSDTKAVQGLLPEIVEQWGPVTTLVNNASLFGDDTLQTLTAEIFDTHMAINLRAPVLLSQAFARLLPDTAAGTIVNIIDQRVWRLNPLHFSYTLSKAALWTATQTMAQALAPRIRVNAIGPGPVLQSVHQTSADFARESAAMPLGQGTTPEEIAEAVLFILNAPSMTGQMIALDGGQHLLWQTPDIHYT